MLKSKDIELRALEPSDVDLLYEWENDESAWWLSNTVTPFSKFILEQYVLNAEYDLYSSKQLRLMIDIHLNGQILTIGAIDLFDFDPTHQRAGVGILIIKSERNKGHASKALQILVEYCFDILHMHQIYCNIIAGNTASLNLFKKHNFQIIGLKKDWLNIRNKWEDEYILQLINEK